MFLVYILTGYNYYNGRRQELVGRYRKKMEETVDAKNNLWRCLSDGALCDSTA
jgi:hypothetical protein